MPLLDRHALVLALLGLFVALARLMQSWSRPEGLCGR